MTATGLKAAPHSSKICAGIWRFSAGQLPPQHANPLSWALPRTISPQQSLSEAILMREGAALSGVSSRAAGARACRLLIFTDAWAPQVNGVVRTLETLGRDLETLGCEVRYATPQGRLTVPLPTYPEIRLA